MTQSMTAKDKRIMSEQSRTISSTSGSSRDQTVSITDLISEGEIEGLVLGEASVYLNDDNVVEPSQSSLSSSFLKIAVLSATNGSQKATVNINLPIEFLNNSDYRIMYINNVYRSSVTVGAVATNPRAQMKTPVIPLTTSTAFFDANTMSGANLVGMPNVATLSIVSSGENISGSLNVTSTTTAEFNPSIEDPNIANRFVAAAQGEATLISLLGVAVIDELQIFQMVKRSFYLANLFLILPEIIQLLLEELALQALIIRRRIIHLNLEELQFKKESGNYTNLQLQILEM
jgi:hypothetical protein